MKVVILAGGYGTRISELTDRIPKPMVSVGGYPIIWHIMKHYAHYGYRDFVILLGYKGFAIKEYFLNYYYRNNDLTVDLTDNSIAIHHRATENWKITFVETGGDTMTGGRLLRAEKYLRDRRFFCTYGDGLSSVDIAKLLQHHLSHGKSMTLTAVQPEGRYGALELSPQTARVTSFVEKPKGDGAWVSGGFFVCEPQVLDYISGDDTVFEEAPMKKMSQEGALHAYRHTGFWHPMDTLRDQKRLEDLWRIDPPWKIYDTKQ